MTESPGDTVLHIDRNRLLLHCGLLLNSFSAYCCQDVRASSISLLSLLRSGSVASSWGGGRGWQSPHSQRSLGMSALAMNWKV